MNQNIQQYISLLEKEIKDKIKKDFNLEKSLFADFKTFDFVNFYLIYNYILDDNPDKKDFFIGIPEKKIRPNFFSSILHSLTLVKLYQNYFNYQKTNDFKINLIKDLHSLGLSAELISNTIKKTNSLDISSDTIQRLIDNNFSERESEISKSENEYRYDEYNFITTKDSERIGNDLIFEKISNDFFQNDLIKSIYKMDKIKMSFVQTSYTRQEPIYTDLYLTDEVVVINTKPKEILSKRFTSRYGKNTKYLPAVESFGEGVFFDFDNDILDEWLKNFPQINDRLNIILENLKKSESPIFKNFELTPKFILIHTFSHLIIKELEYLCGYPSTSIQERLYIDEKLGMYGVLIYTIAGSEGSYGGLTSLCESERIGKLIQSAMTRARDCATDPICYHTSGQGVGNLNLSACFSCTLLPETSCEMFNCFLDRRILVDKDYGYFKEV